MRSAVNQRLRNAAPLVLVCAIISCSGSAGSPDKAVRKMVHAYGGPGKVARLQTFVGKGFIKDVSARTVVESFTFDMYRKGQLYKHKITKAPRGTITDVILTYYDGKKSYQWISGKGLRETAPMELGVLQYRFPAILQWVQAPGRAGELLPPGKYQDGVRVRYKDGTTELTLTIDKKSWLLSSVEVKDSSDSIFVYREMYDHYFDLGGIPFPAEFRATVKSLPYYQWLIPTVELKADLPDSLFRVTAEDTAAFAKPKAVEQPAGAR